MGDWAKKMRIDLKVVVLCIAVSATFWFLKAMNKEHSYSIDVPVNIYTKLDKVIETGWTPRKIKVNASAKGWVLLRAIFGLGLESVPIQLNDRDELARIPSGKMLELLSNQFEEIEINYVYGEEVQTGFDYVDEKKVDFKLKASEVKTGFYIGETSIVPSYVFVSGPSEKMKEIPEDFYLPIKELAFGSSVRNKVIYTKSLFPKEVIASSNEVLVDVELLSTH